MDDSTDEEDQQPYFAGQGFGDVTPPLSPAALRQRRYRQRKRDVTGNAFDLPVTPTNASPPVTPVTPTKTSPVTPKKTAPAKRNAGRNAGVPDMGAEEYATAFQALHTIGAGVTGLPGLMVSDAEAKPVGAALKVCADYYGWDFVERFGPLFLLGITLGGLEAKVVVRVRQELPEVARLKRSARRGPNPFHLVPDLEPDMEPVEPTTPAPQQPMSAAQQLRALQELAQAIPEDPLGSGLEPGPVA